MYLPRHFEQTDADALAALMREHPLAQVVSHGPAGLDAEALPLEWDAEARLLRGHVARANALWQRADGAPVLAIFGGPQAYVSPGWYPSKAATHKVVPTWNYTLVHVHGTLRAVHDPAWLRALVGRLTLRHEAARATPWSVDDAPEDFLRQMLGAIVGIEIAATRVTGKWKASQNRSDADRRGVADALGDAPMAALVRPPAARD